LIVVERDARVRALSIEWSPRRTDESLAHSTWDVRAPTEQPAGERGAILLGMKRPVLIVVDMLRDFLDG
jgi:hypothetical protein